MNLVLREEGRDRKNTAANQAGSSAADKVKQARSLLDEAKSELAEAGKYNCCMKQPCDECLLGHKSCDCAEDLKKGEGVCSQCYGGWQRGDGVVNGVDAKKVKGNFHSHNHDH